MGIGTYLAIFMYLILHFEGVNKEKSYVCLILSPDLITFIVAPNVVKS